MRHRPRVRANLVGRNGTNMARTSKASGKATGGTARMFAIIGYGDAPDVKGIDGIVGVLNLHPFEGQPDAKGNPAGFGFRADAPNTDTSDGPMNLSASAFIAGSKAIGETDARRVAFRKLLPQAASKPAGASADKASSTTDKLLARFK